MALGIKAGTKVEFYGELNAAGTSISFIEARFTSEATGMGPIQNKSCICNSSVTFLSTDTADQVAAKIKAAVDAAIAAG